MSKRKAEKKSSKLLGIDAVKTRAELLELMRALEPPKDQHPIAYNVDGFLIPSKTVEAITYSSIMTACSAMRAAGMVVRGIAVNDGILIVRAR